MMRRERGPEVRKSKMHEQRMERLMDERQVLVSLFVRFDEELGSFDSVEAAQSLIDALPHPTLRTRARLAVEEYIWRKAQIAEVKRVIYATEPMQRRNETAEDVFGRELFMRRTGKAPLGIVTAVTAEGYVVVRCADPMDYNRFYNPNIEAASKKNLEELKKHGGTYHRAMEVDFGHRQGISVRTGEPLLASVLLVKEEQSVEEILVHERQHFLNDVLLRNFAASEGEPSSEQARHIKDEVLAYIRDGSSGVGLTDALLSDLYDDVFDALPKNEREQHKQMVREIALALLINSDVFDREGGRAALVAQLVDVPLHRIATYVPHVAAYYRKRMHTLPFSSETLAAHQYHAQEVWPDALAQQLKHFRQYYEDARNAAENIERGAFRLSPADFVLLTEREMYTVKEFVPTYQALHAAEVHPPHTTWQLTNGYNQPLPMGLQTRDLRIQATKLSQRALRALEQLRDVELTDIVQACIQGRFTQNLLSSAYPIVYAMEAGLPPHTQIKCKRIRTQEPCIEFDIIVPLQRGINVSMVCSVYGNRTRAAELMAA